MTQKILLQISNPPDSPKPFCCGLTVDHRGRVVWSETAPLLRRLFAGWDDIRVACQIKGWTITTVRIGDTQPAPRVPW